MLFVGMRVGNEDGKMVGTSDGSGVGVVGLAVGSGVGNQV